MAGGRLEIRLCNRMRQRWGVFAAVPARANEHSPRCILGFEAVPAGARSSLGIAAGGFEPFFEPPKGGHLSH